MNTVLCDYQEWVVDEFIKRSEITSMIVTQVSVPPRGGKTVLTLAATIRLVKLDIFDYAVVITPNMLHMQWYLEFMYRFNHEGILHPQILSYNNPNVIVFGSILFCNWPSLQPDCSLRKSTEKNNGIAYMINNAKERGLNRGLLIIDEPHLIKDTDNSEEIKQLFDPVHILEIGASHRIKDANAICVSRQQVMNAGRITRGIRIGSGPFERLHKDGTPRPCTIPSHLTTRQRFVWQALRLNRLLRIKFKNNDSPYKTPLIMCCMENDPKGTISEEIHEDIKLVAGKQYNNLKIVYYLGSKKDVDISELKYGNADIVICKTALSTGVDIPRCKIMVLTRDLKGEIITYQLLSRITSTLDGKLYADEFLNYGYLFCEKEHTMDPEANDLLDEGSYVIGPSKAFANESLSLISDYIYRKKDSVKIDECLLKECLNKEISTLDIESIKKSLHILQKTELRDGIMKSTQDKFEITKKAEIDVVELEQDLLLKKFYENVSKQANRKGCLDILQRAINPILTKYGLDEKSILQSYIIRNAFVTGANRYRELQKTAIGNGNKPSVDYFDFQLPMDMRHYTKKEFSVYTDIKKCFLDHAIYPNDTTSKEELVFTKACGEDPNTEWHYKCDMKDAKNFGYCWQDSTSKMHISHPDMLRKLKNNQGLDILEYGDSQPDKKYKAKGLQTKAAELRAMGIAIRCAGIIKCDKGQYFINEDENLDSTKWRIFVF